MGARRRRSHPDRPAGGPGLRRPEHPAPPARAVHAEVRGLPRRLGRLSGARPARPEPARSRSAAGARAGAPRHHRRPPRDAAGPGGRPRRGPDRRVSLGKAARIELPETLDPAAVRAVAMDLDRTILGAGLELTPRLVEAVRATTASGVVPIVATGRML